MKKKTLVLGASPNEARYSNMVIHRLRQQNIEVEAFGLREGMVSDIAIDTERKAYKDLDTVTLYVNPKHQKEYYDYILSLDPKRVIFNPGTENMELISLLEENGIEAEVACTLVLLSMNRY
jgi:predicted CoA-binding protein